jgi:Flp pilus assembly protein CpaB
VSSRRTAILVGAILVGVVAVLLIWQYVQGIETRVNGDSEAVSVFVAKDIIKRGTEGNVATDSKQIEAAQVPRKFFPATAIQSTDAVQKKVALFDIAPGTVIVDGMFVDQSTTQISFRERLKNKNHVAISIQVDQVRGVGGFLVPGDEVNMMIFQDNSALKKVENSKEKLDSLIIDDYTSAIAPKPAKNFVSTGGQQWIVINKSARYLYQKVQILAVGSNQLLSPGEQATAANGQPATAPAAGNSGLLTFNVPPQAAQWIASEADGGFYLSLVSKEYAPTALPPMPMIVDTLPGEDPAMLTPYSNDTPG